MFGGLLLILLNKLKFTLFYYYFFNNKFVKKFIFKTTQCSSLCSNAFLIGVFDDLDESDNVLTGEGLGDAVIQTSFDESLSFRTMNICSDTPTLMVSTPIGSQFIGCLHHDTKFTYKYLKIRNKN